MQIFRISQMIWTGYALVVRRRFGLSAVAMLLLFSLTAVGQSERPALESTLQGNVQTVGRLSSATVLSGESGGALTEEPLFPGQTVHVSVFNAPDFSTTMQVSGAGDIAVPVVGPIHVEGLNSQQVGQLVESRLRERQLVLDPHVIVTIDAPNTGITVLGEVRSPGIYQPTGKRMLSDMLAAAGGLTANTGRLIEISNTRAPEDSVSLSWDPTMRDTKNYDYPVRSGDRILVKSCGIAYVGGRVAKPGAYSLCGSPTMTLSEVIAMAGGLAPFTSTKHTYLIRTRADGAREAQQYDIKGVLTAKKEDPLVRENDIVYVSPSPVKAAISQATSWAMGLTGTLLVVYR